MRDDGIVFARKCLKEVHAILTAISLHPRPFSLEVTSSLHRGQCEYFILLARHNNLALRAFNNIDYSISSWAGQINSVEENSSDSSLENMVVHTRLNAPAVESACTPTPPRYFVGMIFNY